MTRSAKLTSIDAVRDMSLALRVFGEEVAAALDHLEMTVQRATDWIEHDRKEYWDHEVRRGWERVSEARAELEKALTYRGVSGQPPTCRQERALLEKAKRRAQTAEEKVHAVRHWTHIITHAVTELRGGQRPMADWLLVDLPRALHVLEQMANSLAIYAEVGKPVEEKTAATRAPADAKDAAGVQGPPLPVSQEREDNADLGPEHASGEASPGGQGPQPG